jgi:hypothetical protein
VKQIHAGVAPLVAFNRVSAKGDRLSKAEDAAWRAAGLKVCAAP